MSTYLWLKLFHVAAAIVAVGTNVTYFVWLRRVKGDPGRNADILRGIKTTDTWLANPAYVVLLVTGILMVLDAGLGFTTFWILAALILFVAMGALAGILFSPALRRQTELAGTGGESDGYEAAARRTTVTGLVTMIPIAAILYLMVMKPTL
jgi:uncharacterized membrane protein